jgi:hypothetical protein
MTHNLIYFLDNKKNDLITIKDTYINKNDAIANLEKIAIEYVKKIEGEKQADICKQEMTGTQIADDVNLKNGLYIVKNNDIVFLYEKQTQIILGSIWNGYKSITEKIGFFGIIEYKIDDNMTRCSCTIQKKVQIKPKINNEPITPNFLDELKKMINNTEGKFNLRSTKI